MSEAGKAAQHSPTPWSVHRTGSNLGIKDASGKFVFRKTVNMLSIEQYNRLSADFEYVIALANDHAAPDLLAAAKAARGAMLLARTKIPYGDKVPKVIRELGAAINQLTAAITNAEKGE